MVGSDKASHVTDRRADVDASAVPNISLCSIVANVSDPSPVMVPTLSSSQSGAAGSDLPVASSRYTPVTGSTSLLAGAVGVSSLASGSNRFVRALTRRLFASLLICKFLHDVYWHLK